MSKFKAKDVVKYFTDAGKERSGIVRCVTHRTSEGLAVYSVEDWENSNPEFVQEDKMRLVRRDGVEVAEGTPPPAKFKAGDFVQYFNDLGWEYSGTVMHSVDYGHDVPVLTYYIKKARPLNGRSIDVAREDKMHLIERSAVEAAIAKAVLGPGTPVEKTPPAKFKAGDRVKFTTTMRPVILQGTVEGPGSYNDGAYLIVLDGEGGRQKEWAFEHDMELIGPTKFQIGDRVYYNSPLGYIGTVVAHLGRCRSDHEYGVLSDGAKGEDYVRVTEDKMRLIDEVELPEPLASEWRAKVKDLGLSKEDAAKGAALIADLQAAAPVKSEARQRKATPVASGVLAYFPDAIREVARVSKAGNDQHNPGQPLHWAKDKSTDHADCIVRHLLDHMQNPVDSDGQLHAAKIAWRALALLQIHLEKEGVK